MSNVAQTAAERKHYIEEMESLGHGIVLGGPKYLQLDLDSKESFNEALGLIITFTQHLPIKSMWQSQSKSGNQHIHIFLTEPMERRDRVFWQSALGSDRVREGLYWVRLNNGQHEESFFVECSGNKLTELFPERILHAVNMTDSDFGSGY